MIHCRIFAFCLLVCTCCLTNPTVAQTPESKSRSPALKGSRPNIILVMTDDQGMGDLSCLGNPILRTPNLDRLHKMSTRFTDFHVSPTCAPSRSSIFSGRHEFRNGVTHTIKERERMALSTTTFPELLRKSGYETGIFGKWHLGDEEPYQPGSRGFSEVFTHGAGGIGQAYPGSCADYPPNREKKGRYFDNVIRHNDTLVQTKGFCTDVFFQAALGWTKQQHDAGKPFFTYITTNAPHGPMLAPEKYKTRFKTAGWDANVQGRYGMIENIDDNVGVLMQKMDEWNLWDNTLLIFMTDNGQAGSTGKRNGKREKLFTAGFKSGKGSPWEGGTHVPAFWCWKGVLGKGTDIPALTSHLDLYKTFCDLAGVEIPADIQAIDGRTLLPLLQNPKSDWADRHLFVHVGRWEKGADPNLSKHKKCAIRTTRWRFVNNQELYDISADPYETQDVAADHPDVIKALRAEYDQWWTDTLPLMVNEDAPFAADHPATLMYEKQLKEKGIPDWVPPKS
ncbi:MAG: arylsulfatase A-like enzyme [Mariniblastus sp.]|jgi:arylsulfatase A-like enzyme